MNNLSEIASVAGKTGLFKVIKPGRSGYVLESLDDKKTKFISTPNHRVSLLSEVSVFTTGKEGSVSLDEVLRNIHKKFGSDLGVDMRATPEQLMDFLKSVQMDYDADRVYPSDVKKLISWYGIILKEFPEFFTEEKKEEKKEGEEPITEVHEVQEKKPVMPKHAAIDKHGPKTNTKGAMAKTVSTPVKSGKKGA